MYVDTSHITRGGNTSTRPLLRESYRANGKVLHRTIANGSPGATAEIDARRLALRHKEDREPLGALQDASTLKQGVSFGAGWTVYHIARYLGLAQALGTTRAGQLALWQVLARVIDQGSRLAAVRLAMAHAACDVLGLDACDAEALYDNLAWLAGAQARREARLFVPRTKTPPVRLLLSDVTRNYVEGTHHALAAVGSTRDGKQGQRQIVIGGRCDEAGHPVSREVFPGHTQDPQTFARQLPKGQARVGAHASPCVGDRGMSKGQPIDDLAPPGLHDMTAMTQPPMEKRLRTGTWPMDLGAQELAAGLADAGIRYVRRRHPVRAQALRDPRHAQLATLQPQVVQKPPYLTDPPRAKVQGAVHQLVARAPKLRRAAWVELTVEERSITLAIPGDAQPAAANLDGGSGLKTALTPPQATKSWCMTATQIWPRSSRRCGPGNPRPSPGAPSFYAAKPALGRRRSSSCSPLRSSTI